MADTITIPVATAEAITDSSLQTHEILDAAAHEQIAQMEDEDYKWLTDRLDALQTDQANLRSLMLSNSQEMMNAFQESREQSRLLIESQGQMISNLLSSVTSLSESALLRLIPANSETSSQAEPIVATETGTETVAEVVPEENAQTQEQSADGGRKKRFRRM